jgi:hypothetical protein
LKLSEIMTAYMAAQPAAVVLPEEDITRLLKTAVRFYCGYATIRSTAPAADIRNDVPVNHTAIDASNEITGTQDFDLDPSEWAIIKPLFDVYVERENASHIEASRAMGVEIFCRAVSEIQVDVNEREREMPKMAFVELAFSI